MPTKRVGNTKGTKKKTRSAKLNCDEMLFVEIFLELRSVTAAARQLGIKVKRALEIKQKPHVQHAIAKRMQETLDRMQLSREDILRKVFMVIDRDIADFVDPATGKIIVDDIRRLPESLRKCIDGITVRTWIDSDGVLQQETKFRLAAITPALTLAAKLMGMVPNAGSGKVIAHELLQKKTIDWNEMYRPPERIASQPTTPMIPMRDDWIDAKIASVGKSETNGNGKPK